ncbi:MAG: PD-(D/E)XK nuclease family protein [Oscillospiraceae bacterium]|nr:PD-(D/E)XK nuclease family protein [Oscillospiraceae bacterium]
MPNAIILNKPFLGGYLNKEGNIGHEIIDFFQTDKGEYYIFNNPWGRCPDDIWVEGTTDLKKKAKEEYIAKYMVLTGSTHEKAFEILYVIELEEKLHRYTKKKDENALREDQKVIKELMRKREITYNGKYLDEIYKDDNSLYLTFKGKKIYKATSPIPVEELKYNFQRNKGYIREDNKHAKDYEKVIKIIEEAIKNNNLQEISLKKVNSQEIRKLHGDKTFLDLIGVEATEQVYTNILHSILSQGELLKHFCEKFKYKNAFDSSGTFKVFRETTVVDGRMDVCAESDKQRVIIENKVNSGLNGIKPADEKSQLSTYYDKWGNNKEKEMKPLCFMTAPNYKTKELEREIKNYDKDMAVIYKIIPYGDIADFIEEESKKGNIPETYIYHDLVSQIIQAFKNLSYETKEEIYAQMFLAATN